MAKGQRRFEIKFFVVRNWAEQEQQRAGVVRFCGKCHGREAGSDAAFQHERGSGGPPAESG